MKAIYLLIATIFITPVAQADILKDFDSLGGNDVLINRAKLLQPDKDVKIVQNRTVKRKWRHELSGNYTNVAGGNAYLETQSLGADYHLHINHRWAVGLSYASIFNKFSKEGRYLISGDELIPDVDAPEESIELVGNFSPIYGKFNLLDMGVVQFDTYLIGTFGNIKLASGQTSTYSYGLGLGLWISQHLTTRFELRQRKYEAKRFTGTSGINTTLASFSIGYML